MSRAAVRLRKLMGSIRSEGLPSTPWPRSAKPASIPPASIPIALKAQQNDHFHGACSIARRLILLTVTGFHSSPPPGVLIPRAVSSAAI
jgi:hypothetical protein